MAPIAESVFEFLFKYRPLVFENGRVVLDPPLSPTALGAAGAAAVIIVVWSYARAEGVDLRARHRAALGALRVAALAVVLFCLSRPLLLVPVVVPQENWVGVLLDDSRSMRIADVDGETRADFVRNRFGGEDADLLGALAERFRLRLFRFSDGTRRVRGVDALGFTGRRTDLGGALDRARDDLSSVPLSGLVVLTDGASNSRAPPSASLLPLEAAGVPVFTVGVGAETFRRDVELVRVAAPADVLQGESALVDVVVRQAGYRGRTVDLIVEEGGRIVTTHPVELAADGEARVVRVPVPATEPGPRRFRFRIAPQPGELIAENNTRETMATVRDGREKLLYFEGEPRVEMKFLRRAVRDDDNLQVVTLQRTARGRFLRLDVDSAAELAGDFPITREALFRYRALILGSVEASFFTHEQLEMIAEFVGRRGGGLLALGGPRAFAEGGWAGTPVADVLPVTLDDAYRGDTTFLAELDVRPTRAGRAHAALRLAEGDGDGDDGGDDDDAGRITRWTELPPLTTVNRVGGLKPGATALLTGSGPSLPDGQIVLAYQRYGRGLAVAFTPQDSWLWQMHADIGVDDVTHERLWRQLLRWLVDGAPRRLRLAVPTAPVAPGEPATIRAELVDPGFVGVNDARVTARVTTPTGAVREVPLEWTVARDGEYRGRFTPSEEGPHEIRVEAVRDGEPVASATRHFHAAPGDDEFFDAQMRAPLLRRIAERTGGRFYSPETVSALPDDIAYTAKGTTAIEENELWDMPVNFLLLMTFLIGEWAYRRRRGLV